MQDNIDLYRLIVKLTAILGASLIIERILSFLNISINRMLLFQYSNRYTKGEKLEEQLRRDKQAAEEEKKLLENIKDNDSSEVVFNTSIPEEKRKESNFDVLSIRPVKHILNDEERYKRYKENNVVFKEFWMQILGTLIAIFMCRLLDFSIWEFFRYAKTGVYPETHCWFEFIFTGIIIGSGSKPINFLMNFLLSRKVEADIHEVKKESKKIPDEEAKRKTLNGTNTALPQRTKILEPETIEELVGFVYDGGDRPSRLENTHKYKENIDLIVYHHTTQHSDAPFEEVVKEFDRKGWLTGYHSIVFKDGTIRILCRWDRFGNHALPHNRHSFGIAFQGNFESNPNIPSSNPEGKKGIITPTDQQLKAGARLTAMYALLQDIPFKFPDSFNNGDPVEGIIPHNLIANKACPGGNFPHEEFRTYIKKYYNSWKQDTDFKKALELFKKKPMVMS